MKLHLELYHTFNALYEAKKQIIIASNQPPEKIPVLNVGLRSRFKWGLIIDIAPPDYETRMEILTNRAEKENLQVSTDAIGYIAAQFESDIRELEGALTKLILYSSVNKIRIDLNLAREILK